ncbi:MAG: GAF domain-containing protein [Melioribacter sp.]|nr:GAF domain-containing protein [Melioribacter sp.]
MTVKEGQVIFREGDVADEVFLVINGEVNVIKKKLLGKTKSYIFSDDSFFGHEEYLEKTSRTSTAVALRDTYLISLSREEIDYLIELDEHIKQNLTIPISEFEEEAPSQIRKEEKKLTFEELRDSNSEDKNKDEEFFKAITDITNKDTIIQNLEEKIGNVNETKEDFPEKKFEELSKNLFNEDGIPKAEVDLSESEKGDESFISALLDEDGIPKPEFELPEQKEEKKSIQENLDDALFSILSGIEIPLTENNITKNDFKEVSNKSNEEKNLYPEVGKKENNDNKTNIISETEQKETKENLTWQDFETEEIFAEVDSKLQDLSKQTSLHSTKDIEQEEIKMKVDQLQMIIKAAEAINSTIKIDEVLKNIVEAATELTDADRGTLYLIDKEKNELWSLIAMGSEIKEIRLKIGEGMAGYVAKTGEILNIKDVSKDPRYRSDFDKASGYETKTALTFPIKNKKGEIIGVLQLLNSKKGEFSKYDEELLNAMSIHSAIALQNAELVEKLLQAERVQSLGKMANFLIQDIKKPILVSKRYAEHLKNKNLSPDNIQIVDMLLEQLNHVADLVQTTSSYSEGKTILRTLNVSLNKTLTDYAARIGTYVESRNCRIENEFDKDVNVKLDVKEFYQCYMHIVKNACDAMPEGGIIKIYTKKDDKEKKVKIFFSDNGLGIAESLKEKIFEPFFTQGKKEGTGLGLAITKQIVEAHGGKIEVQSSLGEGATFIITLPMVTTLL